jgi:hypothetical protein
VCLSSNIAAHERSGAGANDLAPQVSAAAESRVGVGPGVGREGTHYASNATVSSSKDPAADAAASAEVETCGCPFASADKFRPDTKPIAIADDTCSGLCTTHVPLGVADFPASTPTTAIFTTDTNPTTQPSVYYVQSGGTSASGAVGIIAVLVIAFRAVVCCGFVVAMRRRRSRRKREDENYYAYGEETTPLSEAPEDYFTSPISLSRMA